MNPAPSSQLPLTGAEDPVILGLPAPETFSPAFENLSGTSHMVMPDEAMQSPEWMRPSASSIEQILLMFQPPT
jgi:hypothetical protein